MNKTTIEVLKKHREDLKRQIDWRQKSIAVYAKEIDAFQSTIWAIDEALNPAHKKP